MTDDSRGKSGDTPLVSAIIIFLDAEEFIREAIESVCAQTYDSWELLLVDDGSIDASTEIAYRYAARYPGQVRYLEHPNHQNRGKGASRNLGIRYAQGEYIAFLDADDVWLPHKLAEEVVILDSQPEAGMVYGNTLFWHSWTQKPRDLRRNFVPRLGISPNTLIQPPRLLPRFLRGTAQVPCICSVLVRRSVVRSVGGFDEAFVGVSNIYEDQTFHAKVAHRFPVFVYGACLARYRLHPDASMAVAERMGHLIAARQVFLGWLREYLLEEGESDPGIWLALEREVWRARYPTWLPASRRLHTYLTCAKKWLLRVEERMLPTAVQHRLWIQE